MAGRICKHDGCDRPVAGRGMCKSHYEGWRRNNPELIVMRLNEQTVLECMPGTLAKLVKRTGMSTPAVQRALTILNVSGPERQAFIVDYIPPSGRGKRWDPIYKAGKAGNQRLTKERRHAHSLALNRASHARRVGRPLQLLPVSWAAALGVPQ